MFPGACCRLLCKPVVFLNLLVCAHLNILEILLLLPFPYDRYGKFYLSLRLCVNKYRAEGVVKI